MAKIKLGVLREGKVQPDKRVPLTPKQYCLGVKGTLLSGCTFPSLKTPNLILAIFIFI